MKMKKILVAVDFSEESLVAVSQGMDIARLHGASVTLLHVGAVPDKPVGVPVGMQSTVAQYMRLADEYLAEDRDRLEALRERVTGQGVDVSHMVFDGIPDRGITKAADEFGADLVITGTHGRTGLKRFFLGSVAERVVRFSRAHVMVARETKSAGGYQRVLLATDFSDTAERALEVALDMAAPGGAVDVLHCWYLPPLSYPHYAPTKSASELVGSMRASIAQANRELGDELLANHTREGLQVSFHQVEAAPAQGIQEWLEAHAYNLVVLGSHGRRGPARFLLGSVAELTVRHAPCSVLVVHPATNVESDEVTES
jgi:nucleotide-binding universal stress UspA family protein